MSLLIKMLAREDEAFLGARKSRNLQLVKWQCCVARHCIVIALLIFQLSYKPLNNFETFSVIKNLFAFQLQILPTFENFKFQLQACTAVERQKFTNYPSKTRTVFKFIKFGLTFENCFIFEWNENKNSCLRSINQR